MREIKFRQPVFNTDGSFREWHYWGFVCSGFIGPYSLTIDSQKYTGLKDKNGKEIYEGDIIEGVKVVEGDERLGHYNTSTKKTIMIHGTVEYDVKEAKFICKCNDKNTYKSSFYRGCGMTRSEKRANRYRDITVSIFVEMKELPSYEIIGNIYENPELLKEKK